MSDANVQLVRRAFADFERTGAPPAAYLAPDFVWDMSTFRGWPERQQYEGAEGLGEFLVEWVGAWDDWGQEVEQVIDAGDERVVVVILQHGRAKTTGLEVDMHFGHVWTIRDGKAVRARAYASPEEAFAAAGIEPPAA